MKRKVEIDIFNSKYVVKTDVPEEDLNEIISILNKRIDKFYSNAGTITTHKIMVLTILSLAAENYFIKKRLERIVDKVSNFTFEE